MCASKATQSSRLYGLANPDQAVALELMVVSYPAADPVHVPSA
jgi:hypothetical protein